MAFAEKIRPFTEQAMKIEVAPWIRDYVVDMDELYTELSLEKIHNKLQGEKTSVVKDYKELFAKSLAVDTDDDTCHSIHSISSSSDEEPHIYENVHLDNSNGDDLFHMGVGKSESTFESKSNEALSSDFGKLEIKQSQGVNTMKASKISKHKSIVSSVYKLGGKFFKRFKKRKKRTTLRIGQKVLAKGDPGMGKTTWCKKVTWDWAKGLFTAFSVIFFVSLKLVKPGAAIHNIIIEQNPYMKGLKITNCRIENILETFGHRCLLILDGLDEHALEWNQDILSIIRREKLLTCNIIVTSRPHSTKQIEQYFPVILRVEGFTYKKAEQFAFKILSDKQKVKTVLSFSPINSKKDAPIHRCPILLSFLCVLVREDEIDLSTSGMHIGEIYLRMVRCLYKKFTIREGIDFEMSKFIEILMLIGELAFDTLLSGHPMFQRKKVTSKVGMYAFDYGLLIGHEDAHKLFRDETADIYITFPHQSLQEFLGAFYFVGMMHQNAGTFVTDERKKILLANPLLFRFCLWFLRSDKKYRIFKNNVQTYDCLKNYGLDILNDSLLDTKKNYPSLDIESVFLSKDELHLEFLREIFSRCDIISSISLKSSVVLNWVLESMGPMIKNIMSIKLADTYFHIGHFDKKTIVINMENGSIHNIDLILSYYKVNNFSVHLRVVNPSETLSESHFEDLRSLSINMIRPENQYEFPSRLMYRHLTHLRVAHVTTNEIQLFTQQLSEAVKNNCLPCLSNLYLVDCQGMLDLLFGILWPELKHLNLLCTDLTETDLMSLCSACNGQEKTMPKLSSLCLSLPNNKPIQTVGENLLKVPWLNLKNFYLHCSRECDASTWQCLHDVLKGNKLPNIINLGFGKMTVTLEPIEVESLVLYQCVLECGTLEFPATLCNLNIWSCKGVPECLPSILSTVHLSLHTLILSKCELDRNALRHLIQASDNGKLPKLKLLDISENGLTSTFMDNVTPGVSFSSLQELVIDDCSTVNSQWPNLQSLFLSYFTNESLDNITHASDLGFFPKLHTICVMKFQPYDIRRFRPLYERNIDCHQAFYPFHYRDDDPFSSIRCYCQMKLNKE